MLQFRAANKEDYKAIAKLHAKSWQENYRTDFSAHFLDHLALEDRLKVWENRLETPEENQYIILVEQDTVLVGFGCAFLDQSSEYGTLLDNLHVAKEAKGLGVGKQIMKRIAEACQQHATSKSMYLWVLENNVSAFNFYMHLNGKHIETITGNDIGDKEVRKQRIVWADLSALT